MNLLEGNQIRHVQLGIRAVLDRLQRRFVRIELCGEGGR